MSNTRLAAARRFASLVLVLAAVAAAGCGKDGNPVAPPAEGARVLVLGDGRSQDSVATLLADAGFRVTQGGPFWLFTGAGLADQDLVLFLCGYSYNHDVADSVETKLVEFVAGGGGLVGTEWMMWNREYNDNMEIVTGILPVDYDHEEQYTAETYRLAAPLHAVATSLPDSFTTSANWSFSDMRASTDPAKQAVTVYRGSESGDAVVVGVHGAGRTAHWNMACEYNGTGIWSPEARRLLVNLVEYARRR